MALDSLAVLIRDSVPAADVSSIIPGVDARLARSEPGGLYVFALSEPLPRLDVIKLARRVKDGFTTTSQAGLVVWPEGATNPFVATDLFIARFGSQVPDHDIEALNAQWGVQIVARDPVVPSELLLTVTDATPTDVLTVANHYFASSLTEFAHPNFISTIEPRGSDPDDPFFSRLWHLHNSGQDGGTVDADIDALGAWGLTMGDPSTVIAVIDGGFDMLHPDLAANWWKNPGETAGDNVDNDSNGYVDDVSGWDFVECTFLGTPGCGDGDPSGEPVVGCPPADEWACSWKDGSHGTVTAGAAGAVGNNGVGTIGACPFCSVLPLRVPVQVDKWSVKLAIRYAQAKGVEVLSNSWGPTPWIPLTDAHVVALEEASSTISIFFAMTNQVLDNCRPLTGSLPDISSFDFLTAVARSTNMDLLEPGGFGDCMDLLAPSSGPMTVTDSRGTLFSTSTDLRGPDGYNRDYLASVCAPELADLDYTQCFFGTSFSAPVVAGVAGLALTADPGLDPLHVRRLLQDTADRIHPSVAEYDPVNGFGRPGGTNPSKHGFGRINAFEAVRIVAKIADGGKGGGDAFLRDNRLDWGNTEQLSNIRFEAVRGFIGHWASEDIKVDAPPFTLGVVDAASFESLIDEDPVPGVVNRVYVRVRNRGPSPVVSATVKLHVAQFGTALPPLPADFWTVWPAHSTVPSGWMPGACLPASGGETPSCSISMLDNSGSSVAGTDADVAQIVRFKVDVPIGASHLCFLAMVDAPQDRILPKTRPTTSDDFVVDWLTPRDNNVTHRNYVGLPAGVGTSTLEFMARNPRPAGVTASFRLEGPGEWRVLSPAGDPIEFLDLAPGAEVRLVLTGTSSGARGELHVIQEALSTAGAATIMGGFTVRLD